MKRLLLTGIPVLMVFMLGCATARVSGERAQVIWNEVNSEYPHKIEYMPKLVWVDEDIYIEKDGGEVFVNGAYSTDNNTIYLREWWADEGTLEHEFRHAHGDTLGEDGGMIVLK